MADTTDITGTTRTATSPPLPRSRPGSPATHEGGAPDAQARATPALPPHDPPPHVSYPVRTASLRRDPTSGVVVRQVVVGDENEHSPTRERARAAFAAADQDLRDHPDWAAPEVVDGALVLHNDVSRFLYAGPMMTAWRLGLVPSARALYPMQRPHVGALPGGTPITPEERPFFLDSLDGTSIRSRARIMSDVVLARPPSDTATPARWVSLACGAALPVLDALRERALDDHGVELHLVDMDPAALAFARDLAVEQGLVEGRDFHLLERNLVTAVVARTTLLEELGEGVAHVVDALGIFEYFRDASCVKLLRNAYRLLAPGGVLVVANMLSDRRELALNQRGIGWPHIYPRSIEELVHLVDLAGLPLERTTVHIPQDGVYAVVEVDVPGADEVDRDQVISLRG